MDLLFICWNTGLPHYCVAPRRLLSSLIQANGVPPSYIICAVWKASNSKIILKEQCVQPETECLHNDTQTQKKRKEKKRRGKKREHKNSMWFLLGHETNLFPGSFFAAIHSKWLKGRYFTLISGAELNKQTRKWKGEEKKDFAFIATIVVEYSLLNSQMHKIVILYPPLYVFRAENACSVQFMLFNCAPISK